MTKGKIQNNVETLQVMLTIIGLKVYCLKANKGF